MLGADVKAVFGRMYYAQLQLAGSQSKVGSDTRTGALWEAVVDRTGRAWGFHYNLLGIRPDFRADNGFVARTGFVQPNAANRFTLFGKPGARVERYMVFVSTTGLWKYRDFFDGRSLLEGRANMSHTFTLRGGWSVSLSPAIATYAFDPAAFTTLATENGTATPDPFVPGPRLTTTSGALTVTTPQYRRFAASAGVTSAPGCRLQ